MITEKQISKISKVLELRIPGFKINEIQKFKKVNSKLENLIYQELLDLLIEKIKEYKIERIIIITYKQIQNESERIFVQGKFLYLKINKMYKDLIINKSLEDFLFTHYNKDIVYIKV